MTDRTATIETVRWTDGGVRYVVSVVEPRPVSIAIGEFPTRDAAEKFAARFDAKVVGPIETKRG